MFKKLTALIKKNSDRETKREPILVSIPLRKHSSQDQNITALSSLGRTLLAYRIFEKKKMTDMVLFATGSKCDPIFKLERQVAVDHLKHAFEGRVSFETYLSDQRKIRVNKLSSFLLTRAGQHPTDESLSAFGLPKLKFGIK